MSSSLQDRLLGFEATPPKGAWQAIAEALAAEAETYPQRLAAYSEQPPASVWAAVEEALEEKTEAALVVPFYTRYKQPLRYLAAAGLLAALLVSALFLVRNQKTETVAGNIPSPSGKSKNIEPSLPKTEEPPSQTASTDEEVVEEHPKLSTAKRLLALIRPQKTGQALLLTASFIPKTVAVQALFDASSADDLMVYSDDDGNVMKLPKKLFSLVSCRSGDGSCRERVQRLQQKLSANNVSADFFGMLDQLKQLE